MIQGTGSHVGKSLITAGICRILKKDGFKVAPFKSQNMALNSFVTKDGKEIGRAQALQAKACGIEPLAEMNPILLKPNGNGSSHMIISGSFSENISYSGYYDARERLWAHIVKAYEKLENEYEVIVIEGAGSPAEINLMDREIVNMAVARMADCPVILVGDIDRGGLFASFVGTLELLEKQDRERIKGFIINKFRGDKALLMPAVKRLKEITGIPVLGIVDFMPDLLLEDEDSVSLENSKLDDDCFSDNKVNIAVVKLPLLSNYTDFDVFKMENEVVLNYVDRPQQLDDADVIILPGTKNTISDLRFIKERGLDKVIIEQANKGKLIFGICGGYQMLGKEITDPLKIESSDSRAESGLGLLEIKTVISDKKDTFQVSGYCSEGLTRKFGIEGNIEGYEIHMGKTKHTGVNSAAFKLVRRGGVSYEDGLGEGFYGSDKKVIGTYVHGIFDSDEFRQSFLNIVRKVKRLKTDTGKISSQVFFESQMERLANTLEYSLDMEKIFSLLSATPEKTKEFV
jgi:adenosylcobyric acid synthase